MVAHVNEDVALALTDLERNMSEAIVGAGDVKHNKCVWCFLFLVNEMN